jgi:hypothetical protein
MPLFNTVWQCFSPTRAKTIRETKYDKLRTPPVDADVQRFQLELAKTPSKSRTRPADGEHNRCEIYLYPILESGGCEEYSCANKGFSRVQRLECHCRSQVRRRKA